MYGASFAILMANTSPHQGVALDPPVPHPQLKYNPLIDVLLKLAPASEPISTITHPRLNIRIRTTNH